MMYVLDSRDDGCATAQLSLNDILDSNREQFAACSIGEQKRCEFVSNGEQNAQPPTRYSRYVYNLSEAESVQEETP